MLFPEHLYFKSEAGDCPGDKPSYFPPISPLVIIQTDTIMDFALGLKTQIGLVHFYREVQNMELFWEEVGGKAT